MIHDSLNNLREEIQKHNQIESLDYERFGVKRGLRNADGTGVMAGLTKVCAVEGYVLKDGERIPQDGRLVYRGIDVRDIADGCRAENRFGFEETVWLLLMGSLPTKRQLENFQTMMSEGCALPEGFVDDMIRKAPSPNIMNTLARSTLALYRYDENPDDTSLENVLRQCVQLIAQLPVVMAHAYQSKRDYYDKQSRIIHPAETSNSIAQTILHSIRADGKVGEEEARLLDLCLLLHAEHGGGNNSTFATRVLTSSGTDTYSTIAAGIGSLKGPKHGGANIKVAQMLRQLRTAIPDPDNDGQVLDALCKVLRRELGDGSGLIYGMGHAVYTLSDPRAKLIKQNIQDFPRINEAEFAHDFALLQAIERLTPQAFKIARGEKKRVCANVDLYSGLAYRLLGIPEDLYTPLFTVARTAGWSAHRIEELLTCGRIIRPAYKNVSNPHHYHQIDRREENLPARDAAYIPAEERE
ncbi:MAG: citrate synthase [Oscillospiraceae bacterium]|jgi:citrate synthase|nr:citrate synthase [Oscillospiraceae bacterium]